MPENLKPVTLRMHKRQIARIKTEAKLLSEETGTKHGLADVIRILVERGLQQATRLRGEQRLEDLSERLRKRVL